MQRFRTQPLRVTRGARVRHESKRLFACSAAIASGHSKWATIKHDKAKKDDAKNKQRSTLARDITFAVKLKGANPQNNTRLAVAIDKAKKFSVPKSVLEAAIARGQGISTSGAKLESCILEAIIPPSVAIVIELETENKLRTLAHLRTLVKDNDGNITPTGYMFEKRGRVVIRPSDGQSLSADEVLEAALDAGALDVYEEEDGTHSVLTEFADTAAVSDALATSLRAEIASSDIIYDANEDTKAALSCDDDVASVIDFLDKLQEFSEVQAVHINAAKGDAGEEAWAELQRRLRA